MDTIVLTGGGTAGHIVPNIALAPLLKSNFELHYIGRPGSMEEELIKKDCPYIVFHPLECVKLERRLTLKNLAVPFRLLASKKKARTLLEKIKPSVIFSKGGFAALPVMLAAGKIPLILHESDYTMGLANRMAAGKCAYVCTSFADLSHKTKHGICTGAPLRKSIYDGNKRLAETESGLRGRENLLIMGGSSGAQAINKAVYAALDELVRQFNVVHITGKNHIVPASHPNYFQIPFTNRIGDYLAWADFCVTRGGANALFELVALSVPSLVIPLPKGVSRGDQVDNARYFERLGCVRVLPQHRLNDTNAVSPLPDALERLRESRSTLRDACRTAQSIDGTKQIAELIKKTARTYKGTP